jgi:hypothetical protein
MANAIAAQCRSDRVRRAAAQTSSTSSVTATTVGANGTQSGVIFRKSVGAYQVGKTGYPEKSGQDE